MLFFHSSKHLIPKFKIHHFKYIFCVSTKLKIKQQHFKKFQKLAELILLKICSLEPISNDTHCEHVLKKKTKNNSVCSISLETDKVYIWTSPKKRNKTRPTSYGKYYYSSVSVCTQVCRLPSTQTQMSFNCLFGLKWEVNREHFLSNFSHLLRVGYNIKCFPLL